MQSFIGRIAEELYAQHGDGISSLHVLFPNRRARLFFNDAVAQVAQRPIWAPHYITVDEVMSEMSGLAPGDPVRLVTELYKIYGSHHNEPFDTFYFWGEMLLADFDSVDKYRIDAHMLFRNVADLKALEGDLSYLSEDQRKIISRFWGSFGRREDFSDEQAHFMQIWGSLSAIYHAFREKLASEGIGYAGMIHRRAAERMQQGGITDAEAPRNYVIAGFNALTPCEKILFDHLKNRHEVRFFWDYDAYYMENSQQEAGLFLRENLLRYPEAAPDPAGNNHFVQPKRITVVSAPSDSLQCRYVHDFLTEVEKEQGAIPGKETVVVLTDEKLLTPVLHAIPETVRDINITMGYPLRQTLAYSFVERLIELQVRKRQRGTRTLFYHSDVSGLLAHPYIVAAAPREAEALSGEVVRRGQVYVESARFRESDCKLTGVIFSPVEGWHGLQEYLLAVLSLVAQGETAEGDAVMEQGRNTALRYEYFTLMAEQLHKLRNSLDSSGVEITEGVFTSLLRRMLQPMTIPYEGEPLRGLQVMGILETRNLDFEHVVILSMNDDTFPGNRATTPSFIPYNLRLGYGLPTPEDHEGVYAYYFYRLLQRARRIDLIYCSHSDERRTGEPSRYIYQLLYESPHKIVKRPIGLDVNLSPAAGISVEKEGKIAQQLCKFLEEEGRIISPTAFSNYLECPLKFYFRTVAQIYPPDEVAEEIDLPLFGIILHKAMELLYLPWVGKGDPREQIRKVAGSPEVALAVDQALQEAWLHEEPLPGENLGGNLLLVRDTVIKYINTCLLPFDAAQPAFEIFDLERRIEVPFSFPYAGETTGTATIRFSGVADRIDRISTSPHDRLPSGTIRVVDYKTGSPHLEFKGIDALFSHRMDDRNAAVLQTLLYAMMLHRTEGADVQPALYYVRSLNTPNYNPQPIDLSKQAPVKCYADYQADFEERLARTLTEIFDLSIPFTQCEDPSVCQWCDYCGVCERF